jgi:2-hydroxy-6-oxonona-2,4-dienedioate hydrolase
MTVFDRLQFTRRSLARHLIPASAICMQAIGQQLKSLGPLTTGPEVESFKAAQARLFSTLGLAVRSRYVRLSKPAMTAHVLDAGRGNTVVFICGGPTVAAFAPMMAALAGEYRTLAIDRPGSGLSDRLDYRGTAYREQCTAFVASLFDKLRIRKAALIGNSMGGYFSLVFALAEPERVTKLVFLGEVAGSSPDQGRSRSGSSRPAGSTQAPPPPSIERTRASLSRVISNIDRVPLEIINVMHTAGLMPGVESSMATMMEQIGRDGFQLTYSLRPEIAKLKIPTLFIWGDQDNLGPPELGREMARMMASGRCEVIGSAGHLVWLDQTERCVALTRDFLRAN